MNAQQIIAELRNMNTEERREVADGLAKLSQPPADGNDERDIYDVLLEFAGRADSLPEDVSINHDHYLYGSPKQQPYHLIDSGT